MAALQQRVREVLAQEFKVESHYEAGRGGYSYMEFEPLKEGWNIINSLSSVFETWKLVREVKDKIYTTYIFIVRSKKGILRGAVAYNSDSDWEKYTLEVDDWRVLHDMNGFHESNRKMEGTVFYEEIKKLENV